MGRKHTEESKRKIGEANSLSLLGERNPQYGRVWITNGETSTRIDKNDIVPEGYWFGRVISKPIKKRVRIRKQKSSPTPKNLPNCLFCDNLVSYTQNKYCSQKCNHDHKRKIRVEAGIAGPRSIKRYLSENVGYKCSECGISSWNGKRLSLELEHKDGNSENNCLSNLCLLCPNCHSQTPTYRAKNKGNGRDSRRERYHKMRMTEHGR